MPPQRLSMTRGTSYLRSRLIPLLLEEAYRVTALVRAESTLHVARGAQAVIGNPVDGPLWRGM